MSFLLKLLHHIWSTCCLWTFTDIYHWHQRMITTALPAWLLCESSLEFRVSGVSSLQWGAGLWLLKDLLQDFRQDLGEVDSSILASVETGNLERRTGVSSSSSRSGGTAGWGEAGSCSAGLDGRCRNPPSSLSAGNPPTPPAAHKHE